MLFFILSILFIKCSDYNKKPEDETEDSLSIEESFNKFDIRNELSQHIQKLDNLSVFLADSEPQYSIELIEEARFGKNGEPYLLKVSSFVVDAQERVIIKSHNSSFEQQLFIFDSDGSFLTELGRQGKGPGEYGVILGIFSKNNTIYVLDYTSQRLNEYSALDYTFQRSILFDTWKKSPKNFEYRYVEPRNDGNYHIAYSNYGSQLGTQEIIQMVRDSLGNDLNYGPLRFPVGYRVGAGNSKPLTPSIPINFLGSTNVALSQEDELYTNWSQEFLIKKYDSKGRYQSAFYYPLLGVPFELNDYVNSSIFSPSVRDIKRALSDDGIEIPERLPLINTLIIDDENRIWVGLPTSSRRDLYEWWVLKESGELLGKLLLSRTQSIFEIKNGYLYSKEKNDVTGTEFVTKYRIELRNK